MNPGIPSPPTGRRYLVWLTVGLILGISYGVFLPGITDNFSFLFLFALGFLTGTLILIFILSSLEKRVRCHLPDILLFWFVILAFFLGVFRVFAFYQFQYQALRDSSGLTHQYIGILTDNPTLSTSGKTYGFPVKLLFLEQNGVRHTCHGAILLYAPPELAQSLSSNDIISFSAKLTEPAVASHPGGFSMRDYLYRQNYLYLAQTNALFRISIPYQPRLLDHLHHLGETIRNSILLSIDQSFGVSSKESALLKGILLGIQDDFTPEQYTAFADSGLLHITSVSGMHVMFLSQFALFIFRKLRLPRQVFPYFILPVLLLFCAVAAFTPSVCRSTIMMSLFFSAQLLQREPDALTSLSVAALILLMMNPYTLTSYSFLLSFSSTLGIVLFTTPIKNLMEKPFLPKNKENKTPPTKAQRVLRRRLIEPVLTSLSMTAGCLLGMGYYGMRFFRRITWGSFFANLCLLPLASSCFVLGLMNWPLCVFCPFLSRLLAQGPLRLMLWCINEIARIFSHPFFQIITPTPPASFLIPYLVFCIAIYFHLKPKNENIT